MKKIIASLFAASMLLTGVNAFAQIGVGAGFIGASDAIKASGKVQDPFASSGFYAGATYDMEIVSNFFITPGLEYRLLTAKENVILLGEGTTTYHGIAVPVDFKYAFPLGKIKVFGFGNVTLGLGLSNTYKLGDGSYDYYAGKLTAGNFSITNLGQRNRFDVSAGLGAGVDLFEKIRIKGGYNWGAINLVKDGDANNSRFRNYFYIGAAFLF